MPPKSDKTEAAPKISPRIRRAVSWTVGTVAFLLYISTMHPGMQNGDGTELAAASYGLGVPHPTGYPLFMLISKLWLVLTVAGEPIVRLTLLNALLMAGACAVAGRIVMEELLKRVDKSNYKVAALGGFAAGIGSAMLSFHWDNAVKYEVYALQFLLMVAFVRTIQRAESTGRWTSHLTFAAILMALGMAHHRMSTAMILAWVVCWFFARKRQQLPNPIRLASTAILFVMLGLSIYAYLPIRAAASPAINWGDNRSLQGFLRHVQGTEFVERYFMRLDVGRPFSAETYAVYVGKVFQAILSDFAGQLVPISQPMEWVPKLQRAFPVVPAWVSLLAVCMLSIAAFGAHSYRKRGIPLYLIAAAVMAFGNLGLLFAYTIPDRQDYYLFAFWLGWVLMFMGLWRLMEIFARNKQSPTIGYILIALVVMLGLANYTRCNQSQNLAAEKLSYILLPESEADMPAHSILLTAQDDDTYTCWYRQQVRNERRDVVVYASNFLSSYWYLQFFTPEQIEKHQLKTFNRIPRSPEEFISQLESAVITANIAKHPIFTSITDVQLLTALSAKYRLTPVRAFEMDTAAKSLAGQTITLYRLEAR